MKMETQFPNEWSEERQKRVRISHIYVDGFLYLEVHPYAWILENHADCGTVRSLELNLEDCNMLEIGDWIAQLAELTHFSIYDGSSLKSVGNVIMLLNLQVLKIINAVNLEGLPDNLGVLRNLTHLELNSCSAIKSLPNTIAELPKLATLKLEHCKSLTALPAYFNVLVELRLLNCCRIQYLPRRVLSEVECLDLQLCRFSKERSSDLINAKRLRELNIYVCGIHPVTEMLPNLNEFVALETLSIQFYVDKLSRFAVPCKLRRLCLHLNVEELPINLDELPQLFHLDIHGCNNIKYLPSSLKNLRNLQFLLLPSEFRLQTLLFQLNDSVIISVQGKHIRKTWEDLKLDIGPLFVGYSPPRDEMLRKSTQNCSLFASGYLSLKDDPFTWFQIHYNLLFLVQILDLKLLRKVVDIGDIIAALPNLTHLYILRGKELNCLPDTATRLTHLSLHDCHLVHHCDSLGKLSNLKSLDLCLHGSEFPAALDLLFSLEHLSLRNFQYHSIPNSLANLSNLRTLELHLCHKLSLPDNLNLTKLKLVCCSVESLPTSLCYMEIVHVIEYCNTECDDVLKMCLKQLVNLKTLSLTCYKVKFFPSIAGQQNLQTLLFKDCFSLREVMPNVDELVELCTLNISGTEITSLPECITKLTKLQHLILPKCFTPNNLPSQFSRKNSTVKIRFDGKHESSMETSDEDNKFDGIIDVQTSSCRLPNPPVATQGLGDFHISEQNFSIGENTCCSQNQETENLSSGIHSTAIEDDLISELLLCSNFKETRNFGEDRQMETVNLGNEESIITSSNQFISSSFAHGGITHDAIVDAQNSNTPHGAHKKVNKRKKEISREDILSLRDEHIKLIEAANKLGVSKSTLKRRCKEHELGEWPSSRKKKSNCTKKRKINTKSSSRGELPQPNLVEYTNPSATEYANEYLDVNPHNLSDSVAERVIELNVANRRIMDVYESVFECTVGTDVPPLLSNVKDNSSSSSFDIKATYKENIVRFKWSFTASLEELEEAVVENLKIEVDSFRLKYMDEEEEWVLINTNEHLKRALSLMKNNIFRLKVTDL